MRRSHGQEQEEEGLWQTGISVSFPGGSHRGLVNAAEPNEGF